MFTGSVWSVVVAHGGAANNTIDSCLIYSTAGPFRSNTFNGHGYGVLVGDAGTSLTVSHSYIYGNFEWGVDVGSGGNSGLGTGSVDRVLEQPAGYFGVELEHDGRRRISADRERGQRHLQQHGVRAGRGAIRW